METPLAKNATELMVTPVLALAEAVTVTAVPTVPSSRVKPSGGALATSSAPTLPPAPVLLSTTKVPPIDSVRSWATTRPRMSVVPPAANGTTTRTVLPPGYAPAPALWAQPCRASSGAEIVAAIAVRRPIILVMAFLLDFR